MLYKLTLANDDLKQLEPLPFLDISALQKIEKDLENLLATHLLDVLFEDAALMPIFQERPRQAEADLYALNRQGDLIIFELKRGFAGPEAMLQALRYGQEAGQWSYNTLQKKYRVYCGKNDESLSKAHCEAFNLERELLPSDFNKNQKFIIIGNAANDKLIDAVDYWKRQGIAADFIPYRIFQINDQYYFEFFAIPYDRHPNPAYFKGVLFDTNRSWNDDSVWEMMTKKRVAAYGGVKHVIDYLNPKDIVFFSHKWVGLVAAAEVIGPAKEEGPDEKYRDVKFLTPVPSKDKGIQNYMPFSQVSSVLNQKFFWARTIKVPYLNRQQSDTLLEELNKIL